MFKNHLEMIGRNETPSKKAKFWQSYIRSLKGSEDIRAQESPRSNSYRPLSSLPEFTPSFRSIYESPNASAAERISGTGYRYLPVHRDTYGYSPRDIYAHTRPASTVDTRAYDPDKAWNEHLDRVANIERRYPSRYGLYLKDKPLTMWPLEYEPETKPGPDRMSRAGSLPPMLDGRARSVSPFGPRESSLPRSLRASSLDPVLEDIFNRYDIPSYSSLRSPTPVKLGRWGPRPSEVAFNSEGVPIYAPGLSRTALNNLFNPRPWLPLTSIARDPWWYHYPALKPHDPYVPYHQRSPFFLRDSYLSPVKRRYLWMKHPLRPFAHVHSY